MASKSHPNVTEPGPTSTDLKDPKENQNNNTETSVAYSENCGAHESTESSLCSDRSEESMDRISTTTTTSAITKPHKSNDPRWEAIQLVRARYGPLGLAHFRLLRLVGSGDIGSVYLAELTSTGTGMVTSICRFAMKVMDKVALAQRKKLIRAQTEREILQCLDHPFLPTLYGHFETEKFACLVMEFCPGGDLHMLRQRQPGRCFAEYAARFYVAEVLLALEYLHMLGIIYRDLKPENVLVRDDGHIMLSDFDLSLHTSFSPTLICSSNQDSNQTPNGGLCVRPAACIEPVVCAGPTATCFTPGFLFSRSKNHRRSKSDIANQVRPFPELVAEPTDARSMSFVGTHEYLAPEIIKGEGHGSAVDWWTLGIFLYELLFGKTPFKGSANRATLFNVVGQQLRFPDAPAVTFAARDLVRGLLVKEPQHRLGFKRGATEIKQHQFFNGVNWALIRCAVPPQVPVEVVERNFASTGDGSGKGFVGSMSQSGGSECNYLEFDFF